MIEPSDTTNPKSRRGAGLNESYGPEAKIPNLELPVEAHSALNLSGSVQLHMSYRPADGVQVRKEAFGLLFYDYRGPRLYFVPSKNLIDVGFFTGRQSVSGLIASICAQKECTQALVEERITRVLAKLEDKGLIYGQPIR
ncbi:MAG: mycofactocin biosynthesis chaperone MftB [Desulfobacterales bacterium]|jgi:putative mycofactocin binding protein MftB